MRFLDVCRNPAARSPSNNPVPYLLIVQGDYVEIRASKLVVPLRREAHAPPLIRDIMPVVNVLGEAFVVMTPEMAAVSVSHIGPVVSSLNHDYFAIRRAIDVLTGDF
ncbi:CcdB family protein [Azospirillum sp. TSO35-2]|uniref:CcdB family protein n=1 Tax=Azospirillum sp. TSO35-2 TaxID=716796 RepID=UPI000D6489C4|nr:CcdB family protein [Azospirillum sp. TSO35-2]